MKQKLSPHTFPPIQPIALCCEPPPQNLTSREDSRFQGLEVNQTKCTFDYRSAPLRHIHCDWKPAGHNRLYRPSSIWSETLPPFGFCTRPCVHHLAHGRLIKSDLFHYLCVPNLHYSEDIVMHNLNFVQTIRTHKFAIKENSITPAVHYLLLIHCPSHTRQDVHSMFSIECCICVLLQRTSKCIFNAAI